MNGVVVALLGLSLLASCGNGGRDASDSDGASVDGGTGDAAVAHCPEPVYPAGPYGAQIGSVLADRSWTGASASGAAGTVSLHDDGFSGCASEAPVLVVRVDAAWCGTCQSYAAHGKMLLGSDVGASVRLLDVVLFDQDNGPSTAADAPRWQALEDVVTAVAVDPALSVQDLLPPSTQLPVMLVVDAQTMVLRDVLGNPTEDALEQSVRTALATAQGQPAPTAPPPVLADGRFTRDQSALIAQMALTTPPAPDPSNQYADSIPGAALGSKFFVDFRFSPDGMVACNSCHGQLRQFTDGFPTSPDGVGRVNRNSPSLTLSAYTRWAFDDGRADSLWSQALVPIELPNEFGSSRLIVAHAIATNYGALYETVFGPLPPLDDTTRFPPAGKPGDAAYDAMAPADQDAVTQVFVNVGKSLEAFERTLRGAGATLDSYASGQTSALADDEKDGLLAFFQAGCAQCHYGPRLTDDAFHVLRFPGGSIEDGADPGRQAGIPQLLASDFDLGSRWSDDPSLARPAPVATPGTLGAFKTPQLRNVALTAPYGHGGNYTNMSDVVELIRTGGLPAGSTLTEGTTEPWVTTFDASLDGPLVTFMNSLQMQTSH